jgi:hypothetical protein
MERTRCESNGVTGHAKTSFEQQAQSSCALSITSALAKLLQRRQGLVMWPHALHS